jgi:dTDP-4-amino-4,6-dideoxygalactose transaminase
MKEKGVDTGIHWMPGNRFTWLKDCRGANDLPVTDRVGDEILTLPLWSYMTEEVIHTVAASIRSFFRLPSLK